jgi:pimeloyl-ACP methyl ester carboxylesterase
MVTHDQIFSEIWQNRIVSDSTISARINAVRTAVGDTGKEQRIIKTIPRRGFQMVVSVQKETDSSEPSQSTPLSRQTIRFCTSNDGTGIAYAISGHGPPVMRAGHWLTHLELDWHSPVFRPMVDALSRDHTLVRYDQRGTGLSDRTTPEFSVQAFAKDMKAVADAAGLARCPIVASSQGAPTAIQFAVNNPGRVSHLVIWGGYAEGWAVRDGGANSAASDPFGALIQSGWGHADSAFMSAFTALFFPDATNEQINNMVATQIASASPDIAAKLRAALISIDVSGILDRVQAPTLVIHANNDSVHPLSQGRLLASRIPNAEFLIVDSNNHIALPQERVWQDMITATLDFINLDFD